MSQAELPPSLLAALGDLYDTVIARPDQTVHRLAEQAVLSWTIALDGKGLVQPRLNVSGFLPAGFAFGMEPNAQNQLDAVPLPQDAQAYLRLLGERLALLRAALERFFDHTGYRNSTDQCDQLMVELSHFSRFLGARCLEVERSHGDPAEGAAVDLFSGSGPSGSGPDSLLFEARFHMFYWEPFLNDAIVAWQQNSLPDYLSALRRLHEALLAPEGARHALPYEPGYPCRALGRPRHKVIVMRPDNRPLRGKSLFELRLTQLVRRMEARADLPLRSALELEHEIRHFAHMVNSGVFAIATEPSFQMVGRQALSLIRGRPSIHPFLLDPVEFFKKALLFFNGTYTIAGGGIDPMYVQTRQLERYYRFEHWVSAREVRGPLEASLIGWEENRWDAFTAGVLRVAELLRDRAAA